MRIIFFALVLIGAHQAFSQQNNDEFYTISEKIENLLRYKAKNTTQLRTLLKELKEHSTSNESSYNQIKRRVDNVLFPLEIKLVRSDVYNHNYREAVKKTESLKSSHSYDYRIQKLEKYVDRKVFKYCKKEMMKERPYLVSIEPLISFLTQETTIEDGSFRLNNLQPSYSLGIYARVNNKIKTQTTKRTRYNYSQIGLKAEYRDTSYRIVTDTAYNKLSPYTNLQLSFLIRKTLGFDFGYVIYNDKAKEDNLYSFTLSFYIPIRFVSLGINGRVLSDFNQESPSLLQFGGSLKLNLGCFKNYTLRDREETQARVLKYKGN